MKESLAMIRVNPNKCYWGGLGNRVERGDSFLNNSYHPDISNSERFHKLQVEKFGNLGLRLARNIK